NLKKSEGFYRSILGLKISARNLRTKMTFLSYGREHHDVALMELQLGAKHVAGKGMPKMHHFCIYVGSNDVIDNLYPVLKRRKIPIVSGPETLVVAGNRSISFLDPDGNRWRSLAMPISSSTTTEGNNSRQGFGRKRYCRPVVGLNLLNVLNCLNVSSSATR